MRNLWVLFLFLFTLHGTAQQHLEGYVYDAKTQEKLMGAAVYYEGTTLGTITDSNGRFVIDLSGASTSNIVISFLGYQDKVIPYTEDAIKIFLNPKLENLDEVIIQANLPFTREEMLTAFREQFLGITIAGKSCSIENEDALTFYYDTQKNTLSADADEGLLVRNSYLGYEIRYRLYKFQVNFITKSLKPFDANLSYFSGTSFYKDVQEGKRRFIRRRARAYKGSTLELMRLLATEQFEQEPYQFFKKRVTANPKDIFQVSDTIGIKKVVFKDNINIIYNKREQSGMRSLMPHFTIDGYGNHLANSVIFTGTMGAERLGDSLPLDYNLESVEIKE